MDNRVASLEGYFDEKLKECLAPFCSVSGKWDIESLKIVLTKAHTQIKNKGDALMLTA